MPTPLTPAELRSYADSTGYRDPYAVVGASRDASPEDVDARTRQQMLNIQRDRGQGTFQHDPKAVHKSIVENTIKLKELDSAHALITQKPEIAAAVSDYIKQNPRPEGNNKPQPNMDRLIDDEKAFEERLKERMISRETQKIREKAANMYVSLPAEGIPRVDGSEVFTAVGRGEQGKVDLVFNDRQKPRPYMNQAAIEMLKAGGIEVTGTQHDRFISIPEGKLPDALKALGVSAQEADKLTAKIGMGIENAELRSAEIKRRNRMDLEKGPVKPGSEEELRRKQFDAAMEGRIGAAANRGEPHATREHIEAIAERKVATTKPINPAVAAEAVAVSRRNGIAGAITAGVSAATIELINGAGPAEATRKAVEALTPLSQAVKEAMRGNYDKAIISGAEDLGMYVGGATGGILGGAAGSAVAPGLGTAAGIVGGGAAGAKIGKDGLGDAARALLKLVREGQDVPAQAAAPSPPAQVAIAQADTAQTKPNSRERH